MTTETLRALAWYGGRASRNFPEPPRAVVLAMLAELEPQIDARILRPVDLACQRWPASIFGSAVEGAGHAYLACITIRAARGGKRDGPLRTWFQWQHPRWSDVGALPHPDTIPATDRVAIP